MVVGDNQIFQLSELKTSVLARQCSRCLKLFKRCGSHLICSVKDIRERQTRTEKQGRKE